MITIIIPFYNTEKYLEECLSSVKAQTFSDYECLMIDDGSTDSSRSIAQKYADADSRFILLNDRHIGFPLAKNFGLDHARGEYICFVDSDDYILPSYLEELYKGITETNSDICKCGLVGFRGFSKPTVIDRPLSVKVYEGDNIINKMFTSTFMWDKIYRRELFDDLRFKDMVALSDTELCPKIFSRAKRYAMLNVTLICHRVHDESITYHVRNFEPTYWEHRLNIYIDLCNYLLDLYPNLKRRLTSIFFGELNFIRPHLSVELYNKYLKKDRVKKLLS